MGNEYEEEVYDIACPYPHNNFIANGIVLHNCGRGKGQPLWETVITPDGPKAIGNIRTGDFVIGANGKPTRVLGIFPQGHQVCYKISFSDGSLVYCDENHLWKLTHGWKNTVSGQRETEVIATKDLAGRSLKHISRGLAYSVPYCQPVEFPATKQPIDPWLLGVWLTTGTASGGLRLYRVDEEMVDRIKGLLPITDTIYKNEKARSPREYVIKGSVTIKNLRAIGLWNRKSTNKFIPPDYLYGSVEQRWKLLQGLMDTQTISMRKSMSSVELGTASEEFKDNVITLVQSLGGRASFHATRNKYTYKGEQRVSNVVYRICISFPAGGAIPVSTRRQLELWDSRASRKPYRYINNITRCKDTHETVCIKVDAEDELYLTNSYIITHNTVIALDYIARTGGPSLVVVDNTHLLEQWRNSIKHFLDVPGGIGLVQGKIFDWKKGIVLATYHTLGALAETLPEEFKRRFMSVFFDEGHHISAATFAPCAEVVYGHRFVLSATPDRDDGTHLIYNFHIGPIIYKDITHKIKPRIVFRWTGLELPRTADVYDVNGEVHLSKVSAFFGRWLPRLRMILDDVAYAISCGRKVLVLCNSIDEAVNLCSLWTMRNWHQVEGLGMLYSEIPEPTPHEIGETLPPVPMDPAQIEYTEKELEKWNNKLNQASLSEHERQDIQGKVDQLSLNLKQAEIAQKLASIMRARQRKYRDWLTDNLSDGGLMIHKVKPEQRFEYIKTKRVVFAITKYGKEGLDDKALDTVFISTGFSSRNVLQQVMGRPTREDDNKKKPLIIGYEDNIGKLIGMWMKIRRHLNSWPVEENGPFQHELHGHPKARIQGWNQHEVFGP
jgi:superfamily II DNA or RNA helicase